MRAISLVNRVEFDFSGNVVRKGIAFGDVDNDGDIEFVIGSVTGEVAVFKGQERIQTLTNLGFVSCIAIGDILNYGKNCLVVITADGWCYIYSTITDFNSDLNENGGMDKTEEAKEQVDGQAVSAEKSGKPETVISKYFLRDLQNPGTLKRIHCQRIPANAKDLLLEDVDGDGAIEMVLGLTDRVVRSYRWQFSSNTSISEPQIANESLDLDLVSGKLVCLNKWECAKQIGSISLHQGIDEKPTLLVAQPGGTFMRIRCSPEDSLQQSETSSTLSESLTDSSIDYQFLGLSRMRNPNISTEIVGNLKTNLSSTENASEFNISGLNLEESRRRSASLSRHGSLDKIKGIPYAVATLDGTIMLVQDEIILWAIAVDHQIFALTKLDVTGNGLDDIVVCTWDGHTYILDQEKNTVRFQLDESVQAFESGHYSLTPGEEATTCFIYYTFRNKLLLYYDIPLTEMISKKFEFNASKLVDVVAGDASDIEKQMLLENLSSKSKRELVQYLLYDVKQ